VARLAADDDAVLRQMQGDEQANPLTLAPLACFVIDILGVLAAGVRMSFAPQPGVS
jgi:hypothetical protein